MPKMKTHRGAAKRFKKTGTGKLTRSKFEQAAHPHEEVVEAEATSCGSRRLIAGPWTPSDIKQMVPSL